MKIGYQPKGEKSQMRTSRKLTHYLMAVFAVAMMSMVTLAQSTPGTVVPASSEASDQKPGSLLVYNLYQSEASNVAAVDTKINITNTNESNPVIVHFFFVSKSCSVADFKTELTANQTYSFLTSDFDPGTTGYIIAVAENFLGVPISFNYLIGDLYTRNVSAANSYQANLGAVAFAAQWAFDRTSDRLTGARTVGGALSTVAADAITATLDFDNSTNGYNRQPAVVAISNIPSRASNDRMWLVTNSLSGSLVSAMGSTGSLFGLLYDDAEQSQSFIMSGGCHRFAELSNTNPRTVPRFDSVIPAGRTGWMKLYQSSTQPIGILGAVIAYNQQARVNFEGGHNLHTLTVTNHVASGLNRVVLPVFPFSGI
ncbi:MAG: hypothetical protein ACO394_08825 [Blastocatellia bacterium]